MSKGRVLVAMSGGVDSSVAAVLLREQGHKITGVTFRSWDYITEGCLQKRTGCCSIDAIYETKAIAGKLGIEHIILDLRDFFKDTVIRNFAEEYFSGRTPNPCVYCNSFVKWGKILDLAGELGCEFIATGHYARIRSENNRYFVAKGADKEKDQSYFLWNLTQDNLRRTLFPLGDLKKTEVRKIASENGFKDISEKRESQEVCFIPGNDYRNFLKEHFPDRIVKIGPGDFISSDGTYLGKHSGYPCYTVGQRKGLGVSAGRPLYVLKINARTNTITLGEKDELLGNRMSVGNLLTSKYDRIPDTLDVETKIRYRTLPVKSTLRRKGNTAEVEFCMPVSAITPGQSAVFYEGDDMVGGGIIIRGG